MSVAFRFLLGLCLLAAPGCSGCERSERATREPDPASHSKERALRPLSSAMRGPSIGGFRQRLEQEAKDRPAVPLKAEDVLAVFEKDGIVLDRKRQQLASPHLARYCTSAHTGEKVQLTVCEHESVERAEEHVKATQKLERPECRIARNETTTVLARRDLNSDVEAPLVDRVFRAFETTKVAGGD